MNSYIKHGIFLGTTSAPPEWRGLSLSTSRAVEPHGLVRVATDTTPATDSRDYKISPFHARKAWRRPRRARGSPRRAASRSGPVFIDPGASRPRRPGGGPALTSRRAAARRRCRAPAGRRRERERPAGTAARYSAGPARRPDPPTLRCVGARTARSRTRPAAPPPRPPPSSACRRRRARAAATDTGARPSASLAPPLAPPITTTANRVAASPSRGRYLGRPRPSLSPPPGPALPPPPPHGREQVTRPGGAGGGRASHCPATARKGRVCNTLHPSFAAPFSLLHRPPRAVRSWEEAAPFIASHRPSRRPQVWRSLQQPNEAKTRSRCSPPDLSPPFTAAVAHGGSAVPLARARYLGACAVRRPSAPARGARVGSRGRNARTAPSLITPPPGTEPE